MNATVSPSGAVTEGTVVTVTCKKPRRYVLMGDKEVTCQSTGWNNTPKCKKCGKFQSKGCINFIFIQQRKVKLGTLLFFAVNANILCICSRESGP